MQGRGPTSAGSGGRFTAERHVLFSDALQRHQRTQELYSASFPTTPSGYRPTRWSEMPMLSRAKSDHEIHRAKKPAGAGRRSPPAAVGCDNMLCGYRTAMLGQEADGGDPAGRPPVRLPVLNVRPTSMLMRRFRSQPALNGAGPGAASRAHRLTVAELPTSCDSCSGRRELLSGNGHQGSALDRLWQADISTSRGFSVLPSKYSADRAGWDYSSTPSPPRDSLGRPYKGSPTSRPILEPLSGGHPRPHDTDATQFTGTTFGGASERNKEQVRRILPVFSF
ncbi:hypothetical protein FJT64_022826 [Amphibalanus amphitrite]|uniref:Uncharacterized protein n=1 Tax=Amphibalanus amphitrite TaxID=1232801 RepID=A0A6A4WHK4_AMPAM|nr:hypothetical protein FJT64_022826 [Amphibalanus amphitrite]